MYVTDLASPRSPCFACIHQIFCFHYSINLCTTFIHASHPFMHCCIHPLRCINSCAISTHMLYCICSPRPMYQLRIYVLLSFMRLIYPRASFIHAPHSIMRCNALIFLFSCISYVASYPLTSFSPLSCITYTASCFPAYIFSIPCIKSNV